MNYFSFSDRYTIYGKWRNRVYLLSPRLGNIKKFVEVKIRYFIKRITIVDSELNTKDMKNEFLLLINSNPVIVIEMVIAQVMRFGNIMTWMVNFLIGNFDRISTLSWDVLICISSLI